jgi:hypothetical protein
MFKVSRWIKGSIAALAVVAGGATAMTIEHAPYVAAALTNNVSQSTVNRFRSEFATAPSWQRSLAAAAPALSKLEASGQGALSRGCAACQTADGGGARAPFTD